MKRIIEKARGDALEALWLLAITAGMRRGELLGLRWSRFDEDAGTVTVDTTLLPSKLAPVFGKPKTKTSERVVYLGSAVVEALTTHRAKQREEKVANRLRWMDHDLVFPGPLGRAFSTSTLGKRWDALLTRAGLPHIKFHSLRHASATTGKDANVNGKDMADRLGHATLAMTLGRYTHTDDEARRKAAQQIDDYLFGATSAS